MGRNKWKPYTTGHSGPTPASCYRRNNAIFVWESVRGLEKNELTVNCTELACCAVGKALRLNLIFSAREYREGSDFIQNWFLAGWTWPAGEWKTAAGPRLSSLKQTCKILANDPADVAKMNFFLFFTFDKTCETAAPQRFQKQLSTIQPAKFHMKRFHLALAGTDQGRFRTQALQAVTENHRREIN